MKLVIERGVNGWVFTREDGLVWVTTSYWEIGDIVKKALGTDED